MKKRGPAPCGTNQTGTRVEAAPVLDSGFSFMVAGSLCRRSINPA